MTRSQTPGSTPGPRVLVVEDDEARRAALRRQLLAAGFACESTGSGVEGVRLVRVDPPALLLLGVRLADLDSFEACRGLRAEPQLADMPILLLSAPMTGSEQRALGLASGADSVLAGDASEAEVVAAARALLRLRAGQASPTAQARERKLADQALRESESRLRLVLEAGELGSWDFHPLTGELSWDERCCALFGLPPGAPVDYGVFLARLHPEDRAAADEAVARVLAPGSSGEFQMEFRTVGPPDGVERWVASRGRSFFDAQGRASRFIGTVQDITGRRRAEADALKRSEFEQRLVGIVSHDLRSPLQAISLSAYLLLRTEHLSERGSTAVKRILNGTGRMQELVGELLDYTQVELGGGIPIRKQPTDLHELLRRAVEEVETAHPDRRISVALSGDARGEWDPDRLTQVLNNLLGNALKYSPEDAPVLVESRVDAGHVQVVLRNANKGGPIPPALLSSLFKPFRRLGQDSGAKSRSIGLGLFIVEQIIRGHGGTVTVESSAEGGTAFLVRLPRG